MTKQSNAKRVDEHRASQIATVQVTAETIRASVEAGLGSLGAAFYETEQRIVGDNGKQYPHDASLPDGVADTGEVVDVNRFRFLQTQLCGVVCWKLETMLDQQNERIGKQRNSIVSAMRQVESGRTTEAQVERLADFLEVLIEQRAMVQVALDAALDSYEAAVGEQFETKALRAERERAIRRAAPRGLTDRLASLGVR